MRTIWRRLSVAGLCAAVLTGAAAPARAQGASVLAPPVLDPSAFAAMSREQATGWLQTHVGGDACIVFETGESRESLFQVVEGTEVLFDGCEMTLATSVANGAQVRIETYRLNLSRLDPARVALTEGRAVREGWVATGEVPARTLTLAVRDADSPLHGIRERYEFAGPVTTEFHTPSLSFQVRRGDAAERIAAAFRQAIGKCSVR